MSYYDRILPLREESGHKSILLLGPRQTGKTSLLKRLFPGVPFYNLLLADTFLKVSQRPQIIREELSALEAGCPQPVVIDEIQKLPVLLDEVHHMIEAMGLRFILTGSSARKLRRGTAGLLGGRAWTRRLFPLVSCEIPNFDLMRALNFGTIPPIYTSKFPAKDLSAYVGNYLKEEIQAEGLARRIENFSRFLQTASLYNSELVNFANVASDAGVPARTVAQYFGILEDTLVGHLLQPFVMSRKRKAISTAKFYFFDVGVCNALAGRTGIRPKTDLFGKALEHFVFTELNAFLSYRQDPRPLSFWRSKSGYEVDFMIGDEIAVEVKASSMVAERQLTGLRALSEDVTLRKKIVVSMDSSPRRLGDVDVLPVDVFLERLWAGAFAA